MIELFQPKSTHEKGKRVLAAVKAGFAPDKVIQTSVPTANQPWLFCWGPGSPESQRAFERQMKAKGNFVGIDLSYWDRVGLDRHLRITINACHPQQLVMKKDWPAERFDKAGIQLRSDWNENGFVMLIGMGQKSREQFKMHDARWEASALRRIKESPVYGKRHLCYRPKGRSQERIAGCETISSSVPIETALQGCSLVVCRHSNVAVDAIIAGVPVVCYDGAANAVYGCDMTKLVKPISDELRLRFLRNLAWFQWKESEMRNGDMWRFVKELMS